MAVSAPALADRDTDDGLQPLGPGTRRDGGGTSPAGHRPGHARTAGRGLGHQVGRLLVVRGDRRGLPPAWPDQRSRWRRHCPLRRVRGRAVEHPCLRQAPLHSHPPPPGHV